MRISEIKELLKESPKYPKTNFLEKAPVIHEGFPSCFNLSFGEYELIKEFNGQYLHYDHDFIYSKIQPCIRHQDWETIVNDSENRYRYLSLFDMADVSGLIIKKEKDVNDEAAKFAIKSFVEFIEKVGLKIENLRISYFSGATIDEATKGKYKIDKFIDSDPLKDYWVSLGIREDQFIPDKTRDTFLSLRIFGLPTPWGYRNEINYLHQGKLLDIGTVEYMKFQPIFSDDEIVDVEEFEHTLAVSAVGVERICMAVNNLENIWDIDSIKSLVEKTIVRSSNKDELNAMIFIQALRAIHRIVSDGGEYKNLNSRRKEYARAFYRDLLESSSVSGLALTDEFLSDILNDIESNDSIGKIIDEINLRKIAFKEDRLIKGV